MNTDDLIAALGAELTPVARGALARAVALALAAGFAVTIVLFAAGWGARSDPASIIRDLFLLAKTVLPLALGVVAVPWLMAQARPAGRSRAARVVWILPALTCALVLAALVALPRDGWTMALQGKSVGTCLASIPVLSLPLLAALLAALRRGAPEHPARCGAVAGLASAGFAAAVYSLYCIEGSPLFYGTWYVLAILAVAALGALAGRATLHW